VRSIALTPLGKALQPGLQAGFLHIRDALASLNRMGDARVLVISTPPGFTSKWLAPRLYRFSSAYPEIDVRVSSSLNNANFTTDGVDVAIRYLAVDAPHDEVLEVEKLIDLTLAPVCSPAFVENALAYDDLRAGRLVMPFALTLPSGRCYAFVCPKKRRDSPNVQAFRAWLRQEAALDRSRRSPRTANLAGSSAARSPARR
jgi:LysR family glycine cleavage system transcriptional activator